MRLQVLQRILNARQFGLKLIANVTYGYTAAGFSGRMPLAELADSIVQVILSALAHTNGMSPAVACLCAESAGADGILLYSPRGKRWRIRSAWWKATRSGAHVWSMVTQTLCSCCCLGAPEMKPSALARRLRLLPLLPTLLLSPSRWRRCAALLCILYPQGLLAHAGRRTRAPSRPPSLSLQAYPGHLQFQHSYIGEVVSAMLPCCI